MFDKLLLDHAAESGCRVFQGAHVTDVAFDADGANRWIWIIPITVIGVVLDAQAFKRMKLEPEEGYQVRDVKLHTARSRLKWNVIFRRHRNGSFHRPDPDQMPGYCLFM